MASVAKYILLLCLAAFSLLPGDAFAQHYVGIRGGYGGGTARVPQRETEMIFGMYHAGVSWKYFTKEKYVGGVQADLLLMQQGYRTNDRTIRLPESPGDTTGYIDRRVNSIMVPLLWQPHIYMFRQQLRIYLNLGVTFSYNLDQKRIEGSRVDGVIREYGWKFRTVRDNRWGYGLCGGGGLGWSFNRVEVLGEVRYYIGYSDLMKNPNKFPGHPQRSPMDGIQASLGVYYRLGKGGILAAPTDRVAERMAAKEFERMEKRRLKNGEPPEPPEEDIIEGEGNQTPLPPLYRITRITETIRIFP